MPISKIWSELDASNNNTRTMPVTNRTRTGYLIDKELEDFWFKHYRKSLTMLPLPSRKGNFPRQSRQWRWVHKINHNQPVISNVGGWEHPKKKPGSKLKINRTKNQILLFMLPKMLLRHTMVSTSILSSWLMLLLHWLVIRRSIARHVDVFS